MSSGKPYSSFLGEKQCPDFFESKAVVIDWERENLYKRINTRVDQMVAAGLEKEAEELYTHKNLNALQTVGYREWFAHYDGKFDRATAIEQIKETVGVTPNDKPLGFVVQPMHCASMGGWHMKKPLKKLLHGSRTLSHG